MYLHKEQILGLIFVDNVAKRVNNVQLEEPEVSQEIMNRELHLLLFLQLQKNSSLKSRRILGKTNFNWRTQEW